MRNCKIILQEDISCLDNYIMNSSDHSCVEYLLQFDPVKDLQGEEWALNVQEIKGSQKCIIPLKNAIRNLIKSWGKPLVSKFCNHWNCSITSQNIGQSSNVPAFPYMHNHTTCCDDEVLIIPVWSLEFLDFGARLNPSIECVFVGERMLISLSCVIGNDWTYGSETER